MTEKGLETTLQANKVILEDKIYSHNKKYFELEKESEYPRVLDHLNARAGDYLNVTFDGSPNFSINKEYVLQWNPETNPSKIRIFWLRELAIITRTTPARE